MAKGRYCKEMPPYSPTWPSSMKAFPSQASGAFGIVPSTLACTVLCVKMEANFFLTSHTLALACFPARGAEVPQAQSLLSQMKTGGPLSGSPASRCWTSLESVQRVPACSEKPVCSHMVFTEVSVLHFEALLCNPHSQLINKVYSQQLGRKEIGWVLGAWHGGQRGPRGEKGKGGE